jgi:hypothetical protein
MAYVDQYPAQYQAWVAAGGVEDNFRMYMLGTKQAPSAQGDLLFANKQVISRLQEVTGILEDLESQAPAPAAPQQPPAAP